VTLTDKTGIVRMEGAPYSGAPTLDALKKPVVTAGGEAIGTGDDIVFDEANGAVTALQLAPQGGFLGIGATTPVIPIAEVVEFGPDIIAVQGAAVARVRPPEQL
jgi:sporulation protein YlmC with PRC-barrel domain